MVCLTMDCVSDSIKLIIIVVVIIPSLAQSLVNNGHHILLQRLNKFSLGLPFLES